MTEVPKIVHNRLRVAGEALQGRPHPEADLLAAFAEQALPVNERNGVLAHLSLCEDCRNVVILALPAEAAAALRPRETEADRAVLTPAKADRRWLNLENFAWPTLRWAALAAGVAIAASVLLLHPGKLNQTAGTSVQSPAATVAPQISNSESTQFSTDQVATLAKPDTSASYINPDGRQEAVVTRNTSANNSLKTSPNALIANNKLAKGKKQSSDPLRGGARANPTALETMNEAVEVSAASPSVLTSSSENTLMARNDAPAIEKAKPVPQQIETEAGALQTPAAPASATAMLQTRNMIAGAMPVSRDAIRNVTWAIKAGVFQRSLDSGQTWQNALHADHPLLCYANLNEDLWVGGEKGELFHSTDKGLTWVRVQPSVNAQRLSGDVTHLEVGGSDAQSDPRAAKEILVTTNTNEAWSSLDGGTTWNKK